VEGEGDGRDDDDDDDDDDSGGKPPPTGIDSKLKLRFLPVVVGPWLVVCHLLLLRPTARAPHLLLATTAPTGKLWEGLTANRENIYITEKRDTRGKQGIEGVRVLWGRNDGKHRGKRDQSRKKCFGGARGKRTGRGGN